MTGANYRFWLLLGASLAVMACPCAPVSAQTAAERNNTRPQGLSFPDDPSRPSRAGSGDITDSSGSTAIDDLTLPSDDVEVDPDDEVRRPKEGQRRAVQDGDLTNAEPEAPVDGVIGAIEPDAPRDGDDPVSIDMRDDEERANFEAPAERPPAGYDPLLFQIEEIDPIMSRRPERLFRFEPYDPQGIRIGSFVYFPETEIAGAAFNNVFSSPSPLSDVALELKASSRLVSNWKVHALEFRSTGFWSFYNEFPTEDEKEYLFEGRGRVDIARRTNVQGLVSVERTQEGRSAIDASSIGEKPDVDTLRGSLTGTHRFNRLEAQLRASVTDEDISNPSDGFGGIINNDDRDRRVQQEAIRLTYELKPSLAIFAETELNQRKYKVAAFSDGLLRDSEGQRYRFGLDFGDEGEILRGEISLGYGLQETDSAALEDVDGFLFDANVAWRVTDMTSLLLSGRTDISDTTTARSGGVLYHQIGLEIRHAFRPYFLGTAGISYSMNDFATVNIDENQVDLTGGLEYFANRDIILFTKYKHSDFVSSEPDADWNSDEFRVGLRLRK